VLSTLYKNTRVDPDAAAKAVAEALRVASRHVATKLPCEWQMLVDSRSEELRQQCAEHLKYSSQLIVLFHVTLPEEVRGYIAPDVNISPESHDFESVIRLNVETALWTNPAATVILITDYGFLANYDRPGLCIVRIKLNPREIMFERVWCMAAVMQVVPNNIAVLFLDSDAFLVNNLAAINLLNFEIGLTYRISRTLMPVNEGVIVVKSGRGSFARQFFSAYLATYLELDRSGAVSNVYPNIRRWRGGQLSLNAVGEYFVRLEGESLGKYKIAQLPCSRFNLTVNREHEINEETLSQSLVIHLKGNRKAWITRLEAELRTRRAFPGL
jgi:hypothetical protein